MLYSMHNTDSRVSELFKLSIIKETMLWNPNDLNGNGYTALHLACKANRLTLTKLLLSVAHCDPNVKSKSINEELPIQLTTDFRIMQTLIEHGAQMTPNVVFNLISMHNTDSRVSDLFELSITKETMLWNPNDLNSNGYAALHLACKADSFVIVNYLLSVAHCDPNVKSKSKEVCLPLQLTTNTVIIKDLIRHGAKTSIICMNLTKILWEQISHSNLQSKYLLLEIHQLEKAPSLQHLKLRKWGFLLGCFPQEESQVWIKKQLE